MDSKNFFDDIYEDFFGNKKIAKENEKLKKEIEGIDNIPSIEINKEIENKIEENKNIQLNKDDEISKSLEQLENIYISEESKEVIKKIIEYMRKYNEKIEKQYIQFNMIIYSNNKETISKIVDIINNAASCYQYIKNGKKVDISLYNIDKVEEIEQIYSNQNNLILIKDVEGILEKEQNFKDKFFHKIDDKIQKEPDKYITIISAKNKDIISQAFLNNEDIKERIFNFEIQEIKPDVQDVYQEVIEKLQINNNIEENIKLKILDYISVTYPNTELSFPEYRDKLSNTILFSKKEKIEETDIPKYEKEKTIEEVFAELNELVGLKKVKNVLNDLVNLMELRTKTENQLKINNTNLHMVFLGNPGTGKTTVARIVAQILYNLKYIKQNKLIEVSSKDLVAEYVGQTAPKTMNVIEKAKGGVLFIDEAYSLASGNGQGNSYNEEAIATLIQAMENHRDDLVVIFAGYTKEMQNFLNANSGIVSRIGYTLEFEDYTEQELLQIFKNMIQKSGFEITEEASKKVLKVIKEYKNTKNFGNARFVRNLYEKTIIKHASNTKGKKLKKILKTIKEEDISVENLLKM